MGCDGSMCSASDELRECQEQLKRAEETLARIREATYVTPEVMHILADYDGGYTEEGRDD